MQLKTEHRAIVFAALGLIAVAVAVICFFALLPPPGKAVLRFLSNDDVLNRGLLLSSPVTVTQRSVDTKIERPSPSTASATIRVGDWRARIDPTLNISNKSEGVVSIKYRGILYVFSAPTDFKRHTMVFFDNLPQLEWWDWGGARQKQCLSQLPKRLTIKMFRDMLAATEESMSRVADLCEAIKLGACVAAYRAVMANQIYEIHFPQGTLFVTPPFNRGGAGNKGVGYLFDQNGVYSGGLVYVADMNDISAVDKLISLCSTLFGDAQGEPPSANTPPGEAPKSNDPGNPAK